MNEKEKYITTMLNFCVSRIKLKEKYYFDSVREIEENLSHAYNKGYSDAKKEIENKIITEKLKGCE